jgi:hypothetical protein
MILSPVERLFQKWDSSCLAGEIDFQGKWMFEAFAMTAR